MARSVDGISKVDLYYNLKRGTWLWRAGGDDAALFEELHRVVD